jgi:L-lactate dehydrogenase
MEKDKLKHKIAVIGAGAVGSTVAYSLMIKNLVAQIILIDINKEKQKGEVLDLDDTLSFLETGSVIGGDYKDAKEADIIILTAGVAQKEGETRLQLVERNKEIVKSIFKKIGDIKESAIVLIVSNPVDIITNLVQEISNLPQNQIFGTGTTLDSARLRSNLAKRFQVDSQQVDGFILGEHGDSEFVAWSTVNIASKKSIDLLSSKQMEEIENEVKNEAYEIIKAKGATFYGISITVTDIVEALIFDQNKILPVSYRLNNWNGVDNVCLGSLAVVGSRGIVKSWDIELNEEEKNKFQKSAQEIKKYL